MPQPTQHIIVFGATSFVGEILCKYLLGRHGVGGELRWAIAGRSQSKLAALKASLGSEAAKLPVLIADAADEGALQALCKQTSVVISTVGPYALYGSPLVKVCAETGTDYCDLTGEVQWIRRMIAAHEATAKKTGARIVHCCGFDSVPSDLGVHFLQSESVKRLGKPCNKIKLRIKKMRGGASGGTVASLMNVMREVAADPSLRKVMADPYSICPPVAGGRPRQPNVMFAQYEADTGNWLAPFVMAGINTRIVQRTNAISGNAYGAGFEYDEAMMTGKGVKGSAMAAAISFGLGGFVAAAALPPSRWLLENYVVPKPGEGPSPEAQANGLYDFRFYGSNADGGKMLVKLTGDRDPGYGSTAKILGEAGVCLALDTPKKDVPGGILTPAVALGDRLIKRLIAHAGLTFEVL